MLVEERSSHESYGAGILHHGSIRSFPTISWATNFSTFPSTTCGSIKTRASKQQNKQTCFVYKYDRL